MSQDSKYVTVTDANFEAEVVNCSQPVLVDFWAPWCGPCRMMGPAIDELATEYAGKAKIAKVDVDQNQELAVKFGISNIPTILFFKKGQQVDKAVGAVPKKSLAAKLDALLVG